MSRWMASPRAGGCGTRATCCSRVVRDAGAPMSQTRHGFERGRHRWRKDESRGFGRRSGTRAQRHRADRSRSGPARAARRHRYDPRSFRPRIAGIGPGFLLIERSIKNR
ncbi:hypothetical protein DB771_21445 [Burkholderia sp. AU29985]|nr:hypothetical protein EGY28_07590 [Burkholderia dolosa]PRE49969.1 hypothetical protein C6P87_13510 [Burkholderia sp. AU12872]PUA74864.1 hypothetical protein DB771_21445 [Burkholderia sp. AU29985]